MPTVIVSLILPLVAAALGALLWTLTEYVAHRFLGHHPKTRPNPFADEHTRHHSVGDYFAPAWKKALVACAAFGLLGTPAVAVAGVSAGAAFAVGFAAMYLSYEWLHLRAHTHAGRTARTQRLRRHHFHHHFGDPRVNHGVTTTLWDRVFGTHVVAERIRVPHKLAMRWLFENPDARAAGAIRPAFAAHYVLVGGPAPASHEPPNAPRTSTSLAAVPPLSI